MVYSIDTAYFSNIDTEEKAYILGLLYADGCVASIGNAISLCFQTQDSAILTAVKTQLKAGHPIKHRSTFSTFSFTNKQMKIDLIKQGCVPAKSKILTFPTQLPPEVMRHFIRGYFDGDGSISSYITQTKHKNRDKQSTITAINCDITSSTFFIKSLAEFIKNTLDVNCYIKIPHKERNDGTISSLSITGNNQIITFLKYIYDNSSIKITRKYLKYIEINNFIQQQRNQCCSECARKVYADALCQRHYKLKMANKQDLPCKICNKPSYGHGVLCKRHSDQLYYYKKANREAEFNKKYNL